MTAKPTSKPLRQQQWAEKTKPTVSVLVAAHNHDKFIAECLESVLNQVTDFRVEVIAHDDASTDATATIIQDYAQQYPHIIKPIFESKNQLSRNKKSRPGMLQKARGEFIASCDGDDHWTDPDKLTKQVGFLSNNPEYILSFHEAVHIDDEGRMIQSANLPVEARRDYSKSDLRELRWGWMLFGTIVHRNVKIDFPPEYNLIENGDNLYPMLLAAHGGAKFQPEVEPLAYRQHAGGMWSSKSQAGKVRMLMQSYLQIAAYFVRIGEEQTAQNIISRKLSPLVKMYLETTTYAVKPAQKITYNFSKKSPEES